jgi:DNA-binding protein H-NS
MYSVGEDLNYASIAQNQIALLRAATRYFGTWKSAIEYAGLDYNEIRRYKIWTRDRIVERIHELNEKGVDLSWRYISTQIDPQLAAAATKRKHFGSWRNAIQAAGLDYDIIRRYHEWDEQAVIDRLQELHAQGIDLNAKSMEEYDITLITAARRRFDSWDKALTAAGLDSSKIVLRKPFKRKKKNSPQKTPAAVV